MNTYTITLTLTEEQFANFVKEPTVKNFSVDVVQWNEPARGAAASLFREPEKKPAPARKLRGSKVNTAIMTALANGPQTLKGLKESLEEAGLSPGSLSTGLAYLQKEKLVERVDSGTYAMMAKAAE
jgi:hypothetical protein